MEKGRRLLIDASPYETILTAEEKSTFLIGFSDVILTFLSILHPTTAPPPPRKANKSADTDPASWGGGGWASFHFSRGETSISRNLDRQLYLLFSFWRRPIKARAVIASDYKKKRLMIPIYISRLSNDTAES